MLGILHRTVHFSLLLQGSEEIVVYSLIFARILITVRCETRGISEASLLMVSEQRILLLSHLDR
jgi:hypothetical protein